MLLPYLLAEVVPKVEADIIASKFIYLWQMESHTGGWPILPAIVADGIAT